MMSVDAWKARMNGSASARILAFSPAGMAEDVIGALVGTRFGARAYADGTRGMARMDKTPSIAEMAPITVSCTGLSTSTSV